MKKQLRKIALAVIFSMVAAVFAPAGQVAYAATKTFTYAEQNTGEKVTTLFMDKGEKIDLKFNGVSNWKTYTYKWASSNSKVAVVDSAGVITAVGNGIATITLKISGGDGTQYTSSGVIVYVGQKQQVSIGTAATEEIKSYTVEMGKSVILKANGIKDAIGDRYTFNWSSTDTSVAKVSNNGVITTVSPGLTVIQLSVTKEFSGEVMQATPIAVLVTASGVATPVPTKTPTPAPTKAPGATATPTPTPTVAPTNGTYTVKVTSDRSVTLTFANKVTYTAKDVELSQVLDAGDEEILIKLELESVNLDSTGKIMTVKTSDVLTNDFYSIKVGSADKGTRFPVSISAPNAMEIVYTCLGQKGVAYAYDEEIGLDVPVNLSYRLLYNGIDVTESYSYDGYAYFELVSPVNSEDVMMTGDQIYFSSTKATAAVQAVYTYYAANGAEKELKASVNIKPRTLGKYNITGVANWTIIKNSSTEAIDWNNPVKSVVANTNGYKIVALLQDSYGYYYSTDERGVNKDKNIYSVNDEDTLFAMKGYTYTFNASNDNNYYIDSDGSLDAFNADSKAATYITLFSPDDWGSDRKIGAWTFNILAESKLTSIQVAETNVTLLTKANNNEERFCTVDVPVKLIDQYNEEWEGIPALTITSSSSTLNNNINSVANISTVNGEWVLHIDGQAIYNEGIKTSVTFYVVDAATNKKSSGVRVTLKTPATSNETIPLGSWDVGMKNSVISYGNGKESEISAKAELEIYQVSKNGAYKVGLLTDGELDENGNPVKVVLQPTIQYTFTSSTCEKGEIYVLVLGPDGKMVQNSSGFDLGVVLNNGKVTVNVTESLSTVSALPAGKYTIKVTKVNSFYGSNARTKTLYAYFTVEDNTKDVAVVGYNNNRRTSEIVIGETDPTLKKVVCDLFVFTLGGTKWTTVTENMITNIDCDEVREGVFRINSIEFSVPAEDDNTISYHKIVRVNQNIYTGVTQ